MDWLRRNWPDMLIGLALVAVIAGIVATLLTGGSFFPMGPSGTTVGGGADPDTPPSVSVPRAEPDTAAGGADAGGLDAGGLAAPAGGSSTPATDDGPEVAVLPRNDANAAPAGDPSDAEAGPPGAPDPTVSSPGGGGAQPLPPGDEPAAAAAEEGAPSAEVADVPAPSVAAEDAPVLPSPESGDAAANASLPTEPFRVSVGAFGDAANAERQAERFRSEGYPVFIGRQGQFHIVLVGPYSEEAEAREVAGEIASGDFGIEPVIYRFQPDGTTRAGTVSLGASAAAGPEGPQAIASPMADAGAAAGGDDAGGATDDAGEADGGEANAVAETAADDVPVATSGGRLLQVGAYADVASAEPQVQRLEALGLTARRLQESGMVKLVVGPFSGDALEDARTVLDGAGVAYFAR